MSLLRDPRGRLRSPWRLALFLAVMTAALVVLSLAAEAALADGDGPGTGTVVAGAAASAVALLLASWFVMEKVEGTPVAALGLPLDGLVLRDLGRGFALGVGVIGLALLLLFATGSLTWSVQGAGPSLPALVGNLLAFTAFLAVAAFAEELLFRGYPLQLVAERAGPVAAVGLTAVFFGLLHTFNPQVEAVSLTVAGLRLPLSLVNLTLAGVLLGLAYWRTYSLWFATGLHLGWNWVMGFAADLPVSGLEPGTQGYAFFDTPGLQATLAGPELWTGGAFGPEGGLAVTLASLAGVVWLLRTDALSRRLAVRALEPLPDRRARGEQAREDT